jgi:hypothetical protein
VVEDAAIPTIKQPQPSYETHDATMADKLDIQGLLKESKAEYRQLGKSGLRVSVPILGAMSIGHKKWMPWVIEEEESLPLLKAAYDRGLTTWDTGMPLSSYQMKCLY